MKLVRALVVSAVLICPTGGRGAAIEQVEPDNPEDFSFEVEAFEKRAYELGGFAELEATELVLDRNASLADTSTSSDVSRRVAHQGSGLLDLEGKLRMGLVTADGHLRSGVEGGDLGFSRNLRLLRLGLVVQPGPALKLEIGKTVARWGKGYAFNPVAFIDRPKDPGDPDEALEGFVLALAELTRSFDGPLRTLSLTVAMLPVYEGVNEAFGQVGHENVAAKVSALLFDTDLDLVALWGGSRGERYGLAMARNLLSNLEAHAEAAYLPDTTVVHLAAGEPPSTVQRATWQLLGGVRYLSPVETTYIVEYIHRSAGASPAEMGRYYELLTEPTTTDGDAGALDAYRVPFPMRHYLYAKISQKEPWGVLDFFPALFGIVNLTDGSFTVTPELLYKGVTNLELRLRASLLVGGPGTDFGERPNDARIEVRGRYFF